MLDGFEVFSLFIKLMGYAIFIGIGATAIMDLWTFFLRCAFNIRGLDFALVGRWLAHMPSGKFMHQSIGNSPKMPGEAVIGWTAHYVIGIIYAAIVVLIWGEAWIDTPSATPGMIVGVATVVVPFFVMQPCFGMGIAGSKTPNPLFVRVKSVTSHFVFGLGIYGAALLISSVV